MTKAFLPRERVSPTGHWLGEISPRQIALLVLLITAVGAFLRIYALGRGTLTVDEAYTYAFITQPLSVLWGPASALETNPPLYYTLQKLWLVFGDSETAMRSFSVLLGTLTIPLIYLLGRSLGGVRLGLIAAVLIATSPLHVELSRIARGYALLVAVVTLAMWGLMRLLTDAANRGERPAEETGLDGWAAYLGGTALALYVHNTAVLLMVLANLCVLGYGLLAGLDRRFLVRWLIANAMLGMVYLWWIFKLLFQVNDTMANFWIPYPSIDQAMRTIFNVYGQPFIDPSFRKPLGLLTICLALFGLWRLRPRSVAGIFSGLFFIGAPALTLAISFWRPMFIPRALFWSLPVLFVLLAAGCLGFRRPRILVGAVLSALLAIQLVGFAHYFTSLRTQHWALAAAQLVRDARPGDLVLYYPSSKSEEFFQYYFTRHQPGITEISVDGPLPDDTPLNLMKHPVNNQHRHLALGELPGALHDFKRVWLVSKYSGGPDSPQRVFGRQLVDLLGRYGVETVFDSSKSDKSVELHLFQLRAGSFLDDANANERSQPDGGDGNAAEASAVDPTIDNESM